MERVRVSVANLVLRLRVGESGSPVYFGLLNRKALEKGRRLSSAVGGAAQLTPQGKAELSQQCQAEFLEGDDARFVVLEDKVEQALAFF
jgi:hypothetical protein